MDPKKSVGKYAFIFEPAYAYHQFAVYFKEDGDVEVFKIQKYSDRLYGDRGKNPSKIKKNTLGEIDKVTASFLDAESFFNMYIAPSIFKFDGYNLHRMFIGYKFQERMYTLDCILDNPSLLKSLDFLRGSKIHDLKEKQAMINLIATSKNNAFLKFIGQKKKEKKTNLSDKTFEIAGRYRSSLDIMEEGYDRIEISNLLDERLTSYKDFREMFLLKQGYLESVLHQKEELQQMKSSLVTPKRTVTRTPFIEGEQLSLFDDIPKVMRKSDDF